MMERPTVVWRFHPVVETWASHTTSLLGLMLRMQTNFSKKQLENNPKQIETYMKYMGFEGPEGTIDYITQKIEEHIKNKKNENTKN
jgi:hypothetical protein